MQAVQTQVSHFHDEELRARMGDKYDLLLTGPRQYQEDRSVVFWLKEKPNFPLIDAILYRSEDGMPKDVVFLQCSVLSPAQHAGPKTNPKPSRAVLCGKCGGAMQQFVV